MHDPDVLQAVAALYAPVEHAVQPSVPVVSELYAPAAHTVHADVPRADLSGHRRVGRPQRGRTKARWPPRRPLPRHPETCSATICRGGPGSRRHLACGDRLCAQVDRPPAGKTARGLYVTADLDDEVVAIDAHHHR